MHKHLRKGGKLVDCENFHKKLADYENLSVSERAEFLEHTETCGICADEWANYNKMLETIRSFPELKAPDDFISKLNERIDKEKPARERPPGVWTHLKHHGYRYSAAAACVMLAVVIGVNSTEFVDKMRGSDSEVPVGITNLSTESPQDAENAKAPDKTSEPTSTPSASAAPSLRPTTRPASSGSGSVSNTTVPRATQKPVATAIPSNKSNKSTPSTPTLSPRVTAEPIQEEYNAPEANNMTGFNNQPAVTPESHTFSEGTEEAPQSTEASSGTSVPEVTPSNNDTMVASADTSDEDEIAVNSMMDPSLYSLPEANDNASGGGSGGGSGYSRSTETSNSIEVSSANAERAREIISEYSIASDGDCYSVSSDRMEEFLEAMNNAGIEYDQNCVEMDSDTVTFRLIIS